MLTPNNFRSPGSHFFRSPHAKEEKNTWRELGSNPGPLVPQATNFAQEHSDLYSWLQVFYFVGLAFPSSLTEATLDQSGLYRINW